MTAALNKVFSHSQETCLHFQLDLDTCISTVGLSAVVSNNLFFFHPLLSNSSSLSYNTASHGEFGDRILISPLPKSVHFHFSLCRVSFSCCAVQLLHHSCLPCDVWAFSDSFGLTQPAKIRGKSGFILPGENSSQKVSHLGKLRMKERENQKFILVQF